MLRLGFPLRHLLIVMQSDALKAGRREHVTRASYREPWQACARLLHELRWQQRLSSPQIGLFPPVSNPAFAARYCGGGRQTVTLEPLVNEAMGREEVPEIAARPCSPRKHVVDVERLAIERLVSPDAA